MKFIAGLTLAFLAVVSAAPVFAVNFPTTDVPYIPNSAAKAELLNTVITTNGHYYLSGDWTSVTNKPNGVVVKVGKGDAVTKLYYLGETGPATSKVDFDLLILEPGDTVRVVAGLTGGAGENPALWNVTLARLDSWAGSRYGVPLVPLGIASPVSGLDIHKNLWPRTSGFRNDFRALRGQDVVFDYVAESLGHAPKCFDEELSANSTNISIMQNYAQSFPARQAMVHWNGQMFKPYYFEEQVSRPYTMPAKFNQLKPYHFNYKAGTYLTSSITASATSIDVANASLFTLDSKNRNVAIVIPVDPVTGKRQFYSAELVTVTAKSGNRLTVTRNRYKSLFNYTSAGSFPAGSYIAPASQPLNTTSVSDGGLYYNHSLLCPVDPQGRNASDILAEMLSYEFASGQKMERFHGIMFDVLSRTAASNEDCDLDGVAEGGLDPRGVDLYHLGSQSMARKLRAALPGRILTFDGMNPTWITLHTVFNGVESEGFSRFNDSYTKRWSTAVNYYRFTQRWNPSANQYSFCVPKQEDNPPPSESQALRRYHEAGLLALGVAIAHAGINDSIFGPFYANDEMVGGVKAQTQWLGAPVTDLIRPGLSSPDIRNGAGLPAAGWRSPDGSATVRDSSGNVLVSPVITGVDHDMVIEFPNVSIPKGDLMIRFEGKGKNKHLPADTARAITVEVDGRANTSLSYESLSGPVNDLDFTEVVVFYRNAGGTSGRTVTLRLIIEGANDMSLRNFTIHNATDVFMREFENGIVLCNSSERPYTFDLATLFPGQNFKRLRGRYFGDPVTNDGSAVGSTVTLDGYRGLFLEKTPPVTVVNFDRTGITDTIAGRTPDTSDTNQAVWNFSATTPLINLPQGYAATNHKIYGGIKDTWSVGTAYNPVMSLISGNFQNQTNPANGSTTSATGILLWKKEDFLNGANTKRVTLPYGTQLSATYSGGNGSSLSVHLVAKEAGICYVSNTSSQSADATVTFNSATTQWAAIDTTTYAIGSYASRTFTNVEAVGLFYAMSNTNTTGQSSISVSKLQLALPAAALIDEPFAPTGLIATPGTTSIALDWANNTEPDIIGYNVYRREIDDHFVRIASGLTNSARTDTTAATHTPYEYAVTAIRQGGFESLVSSIVSAERLNRAPVFSASTLTKANATAGTAYTASISSNSSDADGDARTYSATSLTPAWLTVAANGALSGTPGNADVGLNQWTVQVSDGYGGVGTATLQITVQSLFDVWANGATTFVADTNKDGVADGLAWLLGASTATTYARSLLPVDSVSNGDLSISFRVLTSAKRGPAVLKLQYSNDLGITDPWTNHTVIVPDTTSTVGGVSFVVTPVSGTNLNQIQATLPASAQGTTGRSFVRLLAESTGAL